MDTDAQNFLEAVSFAAGPEESPWRDCNIYDFHPDVVSWVSCFCSGFRDYLSKREIEIPDIERSFGGSVYFSLSGHGVGFWDDRETEHLQKHLDDYSGDTGACHRFGCLDFYRDRKTGKFNLSFKAEFLPYYLEKTFRAPGGPVPALISPRVLNFPHSFSDVPSVKAIHGTRIVSLSWIVKRPKERANYQISAHPSFSGETGKERLLTVNLTDGRQFKAGFPDPDSLTQFLKIRNFHKVPMGPGPLGNPVKSPIA